LGGTQEELGILRRSLEKINFREDSNRRNEATLWISVSCLILSRDEVQRRGAYHQSGEGKIVYTERREKKEVHFKIPQKKTRSRGSINQHVDVNGGTQEKDGQFGGQRCEIKVSDCESLTI